VKFAVRLRRLKADIKAIELSPRLGGRQGRLGALRDRLALVFGSGRQDVDGQFVGVRVIYRHELDAGSPIEVPGCHRVGLASAGWQ
jgi:hypothetical protein